MNLLLPQRLMSFLVRAIVLMTAFPVHESAHGLAAHLLGDDTAKNQGRISLNPAKHISLWGALFMLFVGVGAAKPVPINARNFKNPKVGMALSSLAGPVSNLILAYLSMVIYRILYMSGRFCCIFFNTERFLISDLPCLICFRYRRLTVRGY